MKIEKREITAAEVLLAYQTREAEMKSNIDRPVDKILSESTGQKLGCCMAAMRRTFNEGLIEYDICLRVGKMNSAGEAFLRGYNENIAVEVSVTVKRRGTIVPAKVEQTKTGTTLNFGHSDNPWGK